MSSIQELNNEIYHLETEQRLIDRRLTKAREELDQAQLQRTTREQLQAWRNAREAGARSDL